MPNLQLKFFCVSKDTLSQVSQETDRTDTGQCENYDVVWIYCDRKMFVGGDEGCVEMDNVRGKKSMQTEKIEIGQ